ncbi:MAG: hydrogenase formation protein HypD [Spirochaetia bacterium]
MGDLVTDRRRERAETLRARIGGHCETIGRPVRIMEVCGTHTVALRQSGVLSLLPESVTMVSGPGCPVCVTPASYIENVLDLIERENIVAATFGDMMKVPDGRGLSLSSYMGTDKVKIVYSPSELFPLAAGTGREVVFLGIGFETTIPVIAAVFLRVFREGVGNLSLYPAFKLVPPALRALLEDPDCRIDGFLLPGHVSAVIGTEAFRFLSSEYGIPGVVTGFEPEDLLIGIETLLTLVAEQKGSVENRYTRVVRDGGNRKAREVMTTLLEPGDALWRGFGTIEGSGMAIRREYSGIDAETRFELPPLTNTDPGGCICGRIIQGKSVPTECPYFSTRCTPEKPLGPCMVSSEGACAAYFQYGEARL